MDYLSINPIDKPIAENKQKAKRYYGKHQYFTTRAWNVVQSYISKFTAPGDVVCDPFGGSGVTAVEALVLGRQGIHVDISPLSVFLADTTAISPIDLTALGEAFNRVKEQCEQPINDWFNMSDEAFNALPAMSYWYPENVPLPQNADVEFVHQLFTPRQLRSLAFLHYVILNEKDEALRKLLLLSFSATLIKTNRTFVSAAGRKESRGGAAIFSTYRYYVPPSPVELNVWEQFEMRFAGIQSAKRETNELINGRYSGDVFKAINASATDLTAFIADESVDYIFTDPPYGSHIAYLDLSTMWHAWLQLQVPPELKTKEAIEGGDINHSAEDYFSLMQDAFSEMFRILKYGRWMSLVFAHKDASYWSSIVESAYKAGFEYVNTVPQQPQTVWSMHKKKNPLKVLAGNLILNFRKVKTPTTLAIKHVGADAVQIMKNTAELVIVRNKGAATTDEVVNEIIIKLLENGLLGEVKTKVGDIAPILQEYFIFSEIDEMWHLPRNFKIGHFIPLHDRIRFYLTDYLNSVTRKGEEATFDDVVSNVLPQLVNGVTPQQDTIIEVLHDIAYSSDGQHWQLKDQQTTSSSAQPQLFNADDMGHELLPPLFDPVSEDQITHNAVIYRLAKLGIAANYRIWIGKKEQSEEFNGERLADLSIPHLDLAKLSEYKQKRIQQIDVIWLNDDNTPEFAFEVEHSTTVKSALERFVEILEWNPSIAEKLVVLAPSRRKAKINRELTSSMFIGHPLYMENKVRYAFYNEFLQLYQSLSSKSMRRSDIAPALKAILRRPNIG